MSDFSTTVAATDDKVSLSSYPVVTDLLHNLVIFGGAAATAALHLTPGASVISEIGTLILAGAGFGLSAIHVSKTSWLSGFLGALGGASTVAVK